MIDVILGLFAGFAQGFLVRPAIVFFSRVFILVINKISRLYALNFIVGSCLGMAATVAVLVSFVFLKPFVSVWENFLLGSVIGFFLGGAACTALKYSSRK